MEINKKKLKVWCAVNGVTVTDLARRLGKSRVTIHRAIKYPHRFGPTAQKIKEAIHA